MKLPRRLLSALAALVCALSLPSNEAAERPVRLLGVGAHSLKVPEVPSP